MPLKDPEARRAYAAEWRSRNSEKIATTNRRAQLKRKYGVTPEEYDALAARQGNRCAICLSDRPGGPANRRGFWHVDHDHGTGQVRGLLCLTCNTGLGRLGDSIEGLERALAYLRRTNGAAQKGDAASDLR